MAAYRQTVGLAFFLVMVGLFFLEEGIFYGSMAAGFWLFVMGYYVLRGHTSPYPVVLRCVLAFVIFSASMVSTLMPWLFYGGSEGCKAFDPMMRSSYGQSHGDFWVQLWVRVPFIWLLAAMSIYVCLADHSDSSYIRQSIRCLLYFWLSLVLRNVYTAIAACEGGDRDGDGVRDDVIDYVDIAMMCAVVSNTAAFLGDMWCLHLLIERLLALEEAFGERLPFSRQILWMSYMVQLTMLLMGLLTNMSATLCLVFALVSTVGLAFLMVLIWLAYTTPLKALRDAEEADSQHAMGSHLQQETRFAVKVIRTARESTFVSGATMAAFLTTFGLSNFGFRRLINVYQYIGLADVVCNALCLVLMSITAFTLPRMSCMARTKHFAAVPRACDCGTCEACAWDSKVAELAHRRISAGELLHLYSQVGSTCMPHFNPDISTTNDVVRHAIIPLSRTGETGKALADTLHREVWFHHHAPRMVTHHWGNRFRDLVAAVVANALQLSRWDMVAEDLVTGRVDLLRQRLADNGTQHWHYWICAICINQHASICGNSMGVRDTVTGEVLPTCSCRTAKFFNDHPIECELNKFDAMMNYLHRHCGSHFLQVVAIDRDFELFSRAWCVAELVEAGNSHMDQHVMLHSPETLEQHSAGLECLKVEECNAARQEDKDAILSKIGGATDIDQFNHQLRNLLLGAEGLLAGWLDGQKLLQEVGEIAARAKARSQRAVISREDPPEQSVDPKWNESGHVEDVKHDEDPDENASFELFTAKL